MSTDPRPLLHRVHRFAGTAVVAWSVASLTGCGGGGDGGGGGGVGRVLPTCITTARHGCVSKEEFDRLRDAAAADILADPEFRSSTANPNPFAQRGLDRLNVHRAHAALAVKYGANVRPGAGVTIAVLDSGVDLGHAEFAGASITETFLQNLSDEMRSDFEPDEYSHGTAVTSIMAARPNNFGFIGVAWGASFKVYTVPIGDHLAEDAPIRGTFDWAAAYRSALRDDPDIVNASFGTPGTFVENYTADDLRNIEPLASELEAVAQKGMANPAIFVWAAGNDHGDPCEVGDENCVPVAPGSTDYHYDATSPNADVGAVARLPELRGHNVIVVAVGEDGKIADLSNRCGVAGPWCIAVPGTGLRGASFSATVPTPDTVLFRLGLAGTSFSAPMVSGGLALMKHFFRGQLRNRALVARLFATADRSGEYAPDRTDGTSSLYGQGLMDLGAAVSPVKGLTFKLADSGGQSVRDSRLNLGTAFGDGLSRSLAGREIASFDALGAPFWFRLAAFVRPAYQPPSVAARHALAAPGTGVDRPASRGTGAAPGPRAPGQHRDGWRIGLRDSPADAGHGLLHLAGNASTVAFRSPYGLEATAIATPSSGPQEEWVIGASLAWRPPERPFRLRGGWLREGGSVLGSTASGAFGRFSAESLFAGFEATAELGGWHFAIDAEVGSVTADAEGGFIDGLSRLTTSAASLRAERPLTARDDIALAVSQPLRVETGSARFSLPVGRTHEGAVLRDSFSAGLAPSARQVDLTARWRRTDVLGGELRAAAAVSHDAGHTSAKPRLGLMAGWRVEL